MKYILNIAKKTDDGRSQHYGAMEFRHATHEQAVQRAAEVKDLFEMVSDEFTFFLIVWEETGRELPFEI